MITVLLIDALAPMAISEVSGVIAGDSVIRRIQSVLEDGEDPK
jgi:hypothetical protein